MVYLCDSFIHSFLIIYNLTPLATLKIKQTGQLSFDYVYLVLKSMPVPVKLKKYNITYKERVGVIA